MDSTGIHHQNISYYDQIAGRYNSMLEAEDSNKMARNLVANEFRRIVESGTVLDFGGGTGLDLEWMVAQNYSVIFCEPSIEMRNRAIDLNMRRLHNEAVIFLEGSRADFTKWQDEPPFHRTVDGVLANFAVFNCIPNLGQLFGNLANVVQPGGHVLALVLDNRLKRLLKSHFYQTCRYLIFRVPISFHVEFNQARQQVFVHTVSEFRKASSPYFRLCRQEMLPGTGFVMIHLIRK